MRNNLIALELEQEENFENQKDFYSSLAFLAMMPFHHLLSAQRIYSSIFNQSATVNTSEENPSKNELPPTELWRLLQEAASRQNPDGADPVILDDCISIDLFETGVAGKQLKTNWMVNFRSSPFQGSAEIYRAEMFLFKRLIYERKEKLGDTFILTDKDFAKYIDYEMFEQLTSDEPEMLLLNSLTSLYQIFVMPFDDIRTNGEIANDSESQGDKSNEQSNYHSAGKDPKQTLHSPIRFTAPASVLTERVHSWKSISATSDEESEDMLNSLPEKLSTQRHTAAELLNGHTDLSSHHISKELSGESNGISLYKLNLASYWRKWQRAAQVAEFDFDILERLENVRAIRFYELTKFLRLELFDETTRSLPNELEIEYERFMKLMPLPTLQIEVKIEYQIVGLIKPLKNAGYVKSFSIKNSIEDKTKHILSFSFNQ